MLHLRRSFAFFLGSALCACATTPVQAPESVEPLPREWMRGYVPNPLAGYKSAQERVDQNPQCALAVTISGGGTISASFGYGVLEELNAQVRMPDGQSVLKEVDYLSTASGGGITAAVLIDMLREHEIRESQADQKRKPTQEDFAIFFAHARFRGVMDSRFVKEIDVFPKGLFASPGQLIYENMKPALTGEGTPCKEMDLRTSADRPGCYLPGIDRLKYSDVLAEVGSASVPQWPVWIPGTTLYTTGTHIPAIPSAFKQLKIDALDLVSSDNPKKARWVSLEEMNYHHSLVLSMAFPGIGPLVARVKTDARPQYVLLADGGQSDNLGLVNGIAAVANDVKADPQRKGLVIVIDGAMQPSDASVATWPGSSGSWTDRLLSGRFGMVFANGAPPLGFNRQAARDLAKGVVTDLGGDAAERVRVVFVRASDLLDSNEPVTFHDVDKCVTKKYGEEEPLNKDECLREAKAVSMTPRDRIQIRVASLAIGRRLSEDLIALGNEAVRRQVRGDSEVDNLRAEILRCLQ